MRALLVAALAAALLVAVVYAVAVQTARGQRIDDRAVLGRYVADRAHEDIELLLSSISIASVVLLGGAIALVALLRRQPALALGALAVIGLSIGTTELLKLVLPRPFLTEFSVLPQASFPSGNATVAMSLALAAALVAPPAARSTVAILGLLYALAVGMGVVSAGWHRPSDVLGAQLVTFAWTAAVCAVLVRRNGGLEAAAEHETGPARRRVGGQAFLAASAALLALAILVAGGVVLEQRGSGFERFGPGWNFAVAAIVVVGLGTVLVALLLWLLRGISLDARARTPPRSLGQ